MDLQSSDEICPLAGVVALELPQEVRLQRGAKPSPAHQRPLILAPHGDLHAAAVYWGLLRSGITALWCASLASDLIGPISLQSDGYRKWRLGGSINRPDLSAVWFRRPQKPDTFPQTRTEHAACLRREWSEFHDNLYALCDELSNALWVNAPTAAFMTENKIVQLHAARQCGLSYPETLVSNDPQEIRRFIGRHGRLIYKSFARYTWTESSSGKKFALWAHMIDADMPIEDASLAVCPGIYQAYVDKKYDVRVTVIGERMFAVRIRPAAGGVAPDWRPHALTNEIRLDAITLPATYESKLKLLMRRLNIAFGCVDLVVDHEGEIHFLEVNQSGDFLFAEELDSSLPLLRAMCSMLATGRTDYALDATGVISYRDYLASAAYQEWQRQANPPAG
jgi:glutathione synthase/RimK-type ligase-like ATP-grasp enzyme